MGGKRNMNILFHIKKIQFISLILKLKNTIMKKSILQLSLLLFTVIAILSCSKSSDDDGITPNPTPISKGTFTLGTYNYENGGSDGKINAIFSSGSNKPYALGIFNSKGKGNSPYYLRFDVNFNTHATGTYLIKTQNTLANNENEKFMNISVTLTDGNTIGTVYKCADTNLTATVTLVDGKYTVTILNNVILTKAAGGAANLPSSYTFNCNGVY